MNIRKGNCIKGARLSGALLALTIGMHALLVPAAHAQQQTSASGVAATQATDSPNGTSFDYLTIAGSAFHPVSNATPYSYPGGGCIAKTGNGDGLFTHKAILPDGAIVRYLRLYYYDTSSQTLLGFVTKYDGAGNIVQSSSASSTDGGFGSALSPDLNFVVDQFTDAVSVIINMGSQNDSTLRLCRVRIAYEAPITDRIFASGFDSLPL